MAGGAALCTLATVVLLLQPQPELLSTHRGLAAGSALSALAFGWLSRSAARLDLRARTTLAALIGTVLVVTLAWQLGTGLRTIALGILPLLVGLATLLIGGWRAVLVAVGAAGGIALLAWHDQQMGRAAIIGALSRLTPASGVWSHVVLLAGGLIFGLVARSLVQRWRSLVDARERQFRELLATSADRFFELDAELRFAHPSVHIPMPAGPVPDSFIGRHPWDVPSLTIDPERLPSHREDLLAHRPFDIEVTSQPDPAAPPERLAISGRPRWSGSGQFLGYWCVGRDITAKERQREAAERAAAEAEAASRAKSSFLANMSHEIRTPLNGILGLAQLARCHVDERARLVEYLDLIGKSAEALHGTLSNVLDLSRAEAGRLEVLHERVDLPALLHDLHRSFAALCQPGGLACTVDIASGLPQFVWTDPLRLRQILTNYLHNALKFTPSGSIGLAARVQPGDWLRLEVHDSGPGIAESDLALLFKPFTQVDASSLRRHGGSGLGLSICRELAQALGGEVGARSRLGQGSVFWLELPLVAAAPEASTLPGGLDPAEAVTAPKGADGPLAGRRALVAEDNPVNMLITVAWLESWGVQVTQAVDGRAAVQAVAAAHEAGSEFDIVLMDLQMPTLDGLAAAREMRALGHPAPIVALTATDTERAWNEVQAEGFADVLGKPVDAARLHAALVRLLSGPRRLH